MVKVLKWLWAKAEAVAIREVLSLIDSYFVEPVPPADSATPTQKAQFNRDLHVYKAGKTFRHIFLAHFRDVFDKDEQ